MDIRIVWGTHGNETQEEAEERFCRPIVDEIDRMQEERLKRRKD